MTNQPPHQSGPPGPFHPQYPATAPAPARKSHTVRNLIIGGALVLLLCLFGGVIINAIADSDPAKPSSLSAQDQANRDAATATTAPTTAPTSAAATTSAPAAKPTKTKPTVAPPPRVGDGIYTVGEDMPPGRYKVVERADGDCYWSRTKNDSIQDNSVGGGFPSFTAKKGEQVEIIGCPEFERLGK